MSSNQACANKVAKNYVFTWRVFSLSVTICNGTLSKFAAVPATRHDLCAISINSDVADVPTRSRTCFDVSPLLHPASASRVFLCRLPEVSRSRFTLVGRPDSSKVFQRAWREELSGCPELRDGARNNDSNVHGIQWGLRKLLSRSGLTEWCEIVVGAKCARWYFEQISEGLPSLLSKYGHRVTQW